jgi:hypothetical protein
MPLSKISALVDEFLGDLARSMKRQRRSLPYAKWDQDFLDNYLGLPLLPLPDDIQKYIDGQDEFSELEHDAIELAVERHFNLPDGYAAAFCAFTPKPRDVAFIKWDARDEATARPRLL